MKLSKETISILKNYSKINQSILIDSGNKLKTVSVNKTMMGNATVEETFPVKFGLYDLQGFLSTMTLFSEPELEFGSKSVIISDGADSNIEYFYTDESLIVSTDKEIVLSDGDVVLEFKMKQSAFDMVSNASSVLGLEYVLWTVKDGKIVLSVVDANGDNNNSFTTVVGEASDQEGKIYLKSENLKFMEGDYTIRVGKLGGKTPVMEVINDNIDLSYFVALDSHTTI